MKKVEVFSVKIDSYLDSISPMIRRKAIDNWISSEEYKFIEKNSTTIEQVEMSKHDRAEVTISYLAVMDKQIETFWRLKYK